MTKKTTLPILFLLLVLVSGCAKPQVKVALSSTANLNLNEFEEPLPVVVRLYQLADDQSFLAADFSELWKRDLATLGDDLLTRDEIVLNPASQERLIYSRHDQARYVAVMAVFRRPNEERWRDVKPVAAGFLSRRFSDSVTVSLKGDSVIIAD